MGESNSTIRIWARVGAYVEVDKADFINNPEETMRASVKKGKIHVSGDCYVPGGTVHDELASQHIDLRNHPSAHTLVQQDQELNFEV